MIKIVETVEVKGEGLQALLGQAVILLCNNYFYAGKLIGVNEQDVLLEAASIVYETGKWDAKVWADSQKLGFPLYVRISHIEAYGVANK